MTMNADKLTRVTAVLAAVAVTAVAAMISYEHTVDVVTRHGAAGLTGHLYSVVIDGSIVVASMVIADSARRRIPAGTHQFILNGLTHSRPNADPPTSFNLEPVIAGPS
jgi:ammonia channel protein AmtB